MVTLYSMGEKNLAPTRALKLLTERRLQPILSVPLRRKEPSAHSGIETVSLGVITTSQPIPSEKRT
jgi:hypothetical protein